MRLTILQARVHCCLGTSGLLLPPLASPQVVNPSQNQLVSLLTTPRASLPPPGIRLAHTAWRPNDGTIGRSKCDGLMGG